MALWRGERLEVENLINPTCVNEYECEYSLAWEPWVFPHSPNRLGLEQRESQQ